MSVFYKYSRAEQAVVNTICESYLQGVSSRKMKKVLAMIDVDVSKSTVRRIWMKMSGNSFPGHLEEPRTFFVDATYVRVLEMDMYVAKAMYTAMAINAEGDKEIVGPFPRTSGSK